MRSESAPADRALPEALREIARPRNPFRGAPGVASGRRPKPGDPVPGKPETPGTKPDKPSGGK